MDGLWCPYRTGEKPQKMCDDCPNRPLPKKSDELARLLDSLYHMWADGTLLSYADAFEQLMEAYDRWLD